MLRSTHFSLFFFGPKKFCQSTSLLHGPTFLQCGEIYNIVCWVLTYCSLNSSIVQRTIRRRGCHDEHATDLDVVKRLLVDVETDHSQTWPWSNFYPLFWCFCITNDKIIGDSLPRRHDNYLDKKYGFLTNIPWSHLFFIKFWQSWLLSRWFNWHKLAVLSQCYTKLYTGTLKTLRL